MKLLDSVDFELLMYYVVLQVMCEDTYSYMYQPYIYIYIVFQIHETHESVMKLQ